MTLAHCLLEKLVLFIFIGSCCAETSSFYHTINAQYARKGVIPLVIAFYSVFTLVETFLSCCSLNNKLLHYHSNKTKDSGTNQTAWI